MQRFYFSRLGLCDEASDVVVTASGAGGAPSAPEQQAAANQQEQTQQPGGAANPPLVAPPAVAPAATTPAASSAAEPSFMDTAKSMFAGKPQLLAQNRALTTENGMLKAELAQAKQTLAGVQTQLATLQGERAELQRLFDQAQAEQTTVSAAVNQAVTNELGGLGVPPKNLPAAVAAGPGSAETEEELRTQLRATTDPGESGKLVAKINAIRAKQSVKKN